MTLSLSRQSPLFLPSPPTAPTVSLDAPESLYFLSRLSTVAPDSSLLSLPTVSLVSPVAPDSPYCLPRRPRQPLLSLPTVSPIAPDSLYCLTRRPRQFSTVSPDSLPCFSRRPRQPLLFLPTPPTVHPDASVGRQVAPLRGGGPRAASLGVR